MKEHKKHSCCKRPTTCEYCGYHNTHDIVTEKHYPVCLQFPKEQIINQVVAITPLPATVSPQYLYNLPPVVFNLTDYQEMKQANEVWTSPPYYTHTRGYKMCLKVYPNGSGSGKSTHISVYAYLMRGEYDDELEWPFEGDINIEVCNWREDKNHILKTIDLNRHTDEDGTITSRVMDKETGKSSGFLKIISHTDLAYNSTTNTEYLHDDCLQVRVSDVVVYSTALLHKTPSWQDPLTTTQSVCEFTLTEFSTRKQFNNKYYSPPFYTHPQGYKLCLVVLANGYGSSGTYVSIGIQMMRGEHDQHLKWPFTSDITFELLNWRENKKHHKITMPTSSGFGRVSKGKYGTSLSIRQFISHSSLSYNSTTNTEYLQDDCLRLRLTCDIIACPFNCGEYCHRHVLKKHMKHSCHKQPTTCEYCSYHNTRDIVTEKHYPVCLQFPITCPNKCRTRWFKLVHMQRCQLPQHLKECPLQLVECPCSNTGCSVQLPRREMAAHTLQQHNQVLEQIINQAVAITPPPATVSPQYLYNLPPVVFTITDYQEMKQANEVWTSPPYYTHTRGYKFCLSVYPNDDGSGEGTHISVYAHLMRGEYDNELEWPFEGYINIEVCNWREEKNHTLETIHLNRYTDKDGTITSRVMDNATGRGYGYYVFISHTDLANNFTTNTEYLHDDCLQVKVSDMIIYSTAHLHKIPFWQNPLTTTQSVCEFTLTKFSKRKQFNNRYYSPPFYTHPQGYKLCLQVYANGNGSGEGTHVSIFATLMRGEYDQHLQWPFTGDIIIELLNWREDKEHHKMTLNIVETHDFVQVTEGTYGNAGGYHQFISHSSLPYNTTTITEYLQEDCLRLRVSDVAVYSTALLHKIASLQDPLTTTQSVCEFTLSEFPKRKQFNNQYTSPPFYTHPQGYKLCIQVYANGNGSGEGTHVSIYATLMRGKHDQHLQWPFTGDIIIELLNWREDKEHHKETLGIDESDSFVQVTEGTYGHSMGYPQFISQSSLPYNSTTSTEYLQENCLRVRVSDVAVYSTALLHKTPSWQDPLTTTQSVCEFTLTEFSKRKQPNNEYYSPPFYTHPQGYKLCLNVYANGNGSGEGTHVSIFATLMRGDYDQHLQWPFTGDITFELLNWREDKEHHKMTMLIDPSDGYVRVTKGTYGQSRGKAQFISLSSLPYNSTTNAEYLQEDCLRLRVGVATYSTALLHKTPSWQDPLTTTQSVCEFTITEFFKRKQFNNQYYSPPFYTHPQGYKLCLRVYANGYGSGEGTHVSIFSTLMRGEHDQHLQWPFMGDIIIELLNWREDKEHHKETLEIDESRGFVQVTEGTYGKSLGYSQFISQSSLPYNSTTNTEYLQEDCLRLRVCDVAVYSTALLHKTPSWQDPLITTQSVCEFTLTEFSKRKQLNNEYFSPPFYTHPQGYKLCLIVLANGTGGGDGTYVSIGCIFMRGNHDQHLQWPFTGDIIIELLNWREDKEHHKKSLEIDKSHSFVQVTEGTYGNACGYDEFISHSSLPYNSTTNTEYLQDDCLRMRVNVANIE